MDWHPIETAPKDGRRILVWDSYFEKVQIVRWGISQPFGEEPAWVTDPEGPGYSSETEPTHWMPLPDAPKE